MIKIKLYTGVLVMHSFTCVGKFRDKHGRITGYRLRDENGNLRDVGARELKDTISDGEVFIFNLSMTKDGKLINRVQNLDNDKRTDTLEGKILNKGSLNKRANPKAKKVVDLSQVMQMKQVNDLLKEFIIAYTKSGSDAFICYIKHSVSDGRVRVVVALKLARNSQDRGVFGLSKFLGESKNKGNNTVKFVLTSDINPNNDSEYKYTFSDPFNSYETTDVTGIRETLTGMLMKYHSRASDPRLRTCSVPNCVSYSDWENLQKNFPNLIEGFKVLNIGKNVIYSEPEDSDCNSVTIPSCVTAINLNAFDNCANLKTVVVSSTYHKKLVEALRKTGDHMAFEIKTSE